MAIRSLIIFSFLMSTACSSLTWNRKNYDGQSSLELPNYQDKVNKIDSQYKPQQDFYLQWPVGKVKLSQAFRPGRNPNHDGLDLTQYLNAPIYSAHEGYVVYTGNKYRGYGNMIIIQYSDRWATLYAHLNKIDVKEGELVEMGKKIGRMGRTGRATGVHLHFELLKNKLPVDPLEYLPYNRSVASEDK